MAERFTADELGIDHLAHVDAELWRKQRKASAVTEARDIEQLTKLRAHPGLTDLIAHLEQAARGFDEADETLRAHFDEKLTNAAAVCRLAVQLLKGGA